METDCELLFFDTFSHDSCEVSVNQSTVKCICDDLAKMHCFFRILKGVEFGFSSVSTASLHL